MTEKKIVVGMSGGVDSAVAAFLLQKAGYSVSGATLRLYDKSLSLDEENSCCSQKEVEDAIKIAKHLGISHAVLNFKERFRDNVIDRFIKTYLGGGTPNPCVDCNRYVKFERLIAHANELGIDYIATGHYARVQKDPSGRYLLRRALDESKDQTYVLYALTQEQLSKTLFPLGQFTKSAVREIARECGFINAEKKDSQDICFVPDGDYASFIEKEMGQVYPKGDFLDLDGKFLGTHDGMIRYTIGQRKGLGIALGKPAFVVAKDPKANTVTLGNNEDLFKDSLTAHSINLIACDKIETPLRVTAKVRYKQTEQSATVIQTSEHSIAVRFHEPQRAIASGQSVVLYDGDIVIGGGIID